jgi:hypothetical protein
MNKLQLLDFLLTITHLIIVGFNLLGWIWKRTRMAHFIVAMVTAACWFILGIWYGIGYCPITDWQWRVKEKLGEVGLPNSFIKYWADKLTGVGIDTQFIDAMTAGLFIVAVTLSVYLNFFYKRKRDR